MRWKLDENLGRKVRAACEEAGQDVATVREERLQGQADDAVFKACQTEARCLVTLDLDFSHVLRYPPEPAAGIVVLRPPKGVTPVALVALARQVIDLAADHDVAGRLCIVEPGRVRMHHQP